MSDYEAESEETLDEYINKTDVGSMTLEQIQGLCMVGMHCKTPTDLVLGESDAEAKYVEIDPCDIVCIHGDKKRVHFQTRAVVETSDERYLAMEPKRVIHRRAGRARVMKLLLKRYIEKRGAGVDSPGLKGKRLSDIIDQPNDTEDPVEDVEGEESSLSRSIAKLCSRQSREFCIYTDSCLHFHWESCPLCGEEVNYESRPWGNETYSCSQCEWGVHKAAIPGESRADHAISLECLCETYPTPHIIVTRSNDVVPTWNECPFCGTDLECTAGGEPLEYQTCTDCGWSVRHYLSVR